MTEADESIAADAEARDEPDGPADDATAPSPTTADDLLAAAPGTAYFWGRVAGDGELTDGCVTVRAGDETAADALAAVAGARRTDADHRVAERQSAHDASVVRHEDEYELRVLGAPADRASAALGLPIDGQPGGYRLDTLADHRKQLLRGLLESCGTVCFRESAGEVGVSFVHDDEALLLAVRGLLEAAPPSIPTDDLDETSSGGHWFGLADGADVARFAGWIYDGSKGTGLYAADRRSKLRRSVERATGSDVGDLAE